MFVCMGVADGRKKKKEKEKKSELDRTTKRVDIRPFGDFPFATRIYDGVCESSLGGCACVVERLDLYFDSLSRNLRM